jgi:hypothetical protein
MPFGQNIFLNPSGRFRELWALVPQVGSLSIGAQKTKAYHSSLSSAIPIFYILMILAIAFDIYLGVFVLSKQGVSFMLIVGSVILDFVFGFAPFLIEGVFMKDLNHLKVENRIFQKELEIQCRLKGEDDKAFNGRKARILDYELKREYSYRRMGKIVRYILTLLIFGIAGWKIYTFSSVLPPSISIWSIVNGKIIIIFSVLTALFHLTGTERAFAHMFFWKTKNKELKDHYRFGGGDNKPTPESNEIEYEGEFVDATQGNTKIVNKEGKVYIEFIHCIRDGEILGLMNSQTNATARKVVAIKCKENQLR